MARKSVLYVVLSMRDVVHVLWECPACKDSRDTLWLNVETSKKSFNTLNH